MENNNQEIKPYAELLKHIQFGEKNGVSRKELAETLNTNERIVSELVLNARRDGIIIASGNNGFFYPETVEEKQKYYRRFRSMAVTILSSLKTVRLELKKENALPEGM